MYLVRFKALLNDKSVAPIVEITYGAFTDQLIGIATWILVPQ